MCHETAGFFGFFRPHRPQAACNTQPLNTALSALQRERRPSRAMGPAAPAVGARSPLWKPPPTGMPPYWMSQGQRGSPPLWTPRIFAAGLTYPTFATWIAAAKMKKRPQLLPEKVAETVAVWYALRRGATNGSRSGRTRPNTSEFPVRRRSLPSSVHPYRSLQNQCYIRTGESGARRTGAVCVRCPLGTDGAY